MFSRFERWGWTLPAWMHYGIALILSLFATGLRQMFAGQFGDRLPLAFAGIVVATAAYVGGIGPGLFAIALNVLLAAFVVLKPQQPNFLADPQTQTTLLLSMVVWTFISIVCDRLRSTALRSADVAQDLGSERARLSDILLHLSKGYYSVDADWTITETNPSFDELISDKGAVQGRKLWDVFPEWLGTDIDVAMRSAMRDRVPTRAEVQTADGRWFQRRIYPSEDGGLFVFVQDITEQRELDQNREKLLEAERVARLKAEEAGHVKDEFLATLSHELRTPLTSVLGWLEFLRSRSDYDATTVEGLESIGRGAHRLTRMIDDLLYLSRIRAGKAKLEFEFVDLGDALGEALETVRQTAAIKSIELELKINEDRAVARGDPERIFQIFSNLLANAVKFTPKNGRIEIVLSKVEESYEISVTDTGDGIAPEFLPHVFDRFSQADATVARNYGGLGLGLAIVRQLVEAHGGHVRVTSEGKGQGASFTVGFPAAVVPADKLVGADPLGSEDQLKLAGMKIILVEDDTDTRNVVARILQSHGAVVVCYESGEYFLDHLPRECPDALLSDIGMPTMNGYELITQLRGREGGWGKVPAIALTAFARDEDRDNALDAGFNAHVAKPVRQAELITSINSLVQGDR